MKVAVMTEEQAVLAQDPVSELLTREVEPYSGKVRIGKVKIS